MPDDAWIRTTRDLCQSISNTPAARPQFANFDSWQWWMMQHGMRLIGAKLSAWEAASLECIVRHSTEEGIPVRWLFEGGPEGKDERLLRPSCRDDSRRRELDRLLEKLEPLYKKLALDFRVKKDDGMREKVVFTAAWGIRSSDIPRPSR
jgi:hypothetical protein